MKQKIAKKEEKDTKTNKDKPEKISLENNLKKDKETKQIPQETLKDIFRNIIIAIGVIIYFAILNFTYFKIEQENILNVIEICSGVLLFVALILLEIAYKKDSGKFTISAIEFLVLAFHSLSIKYVITRYDYQLQFYLLTSSYVISIYFILKAIIIYTKGRKKYLDTLSDIPEILKKDEPVKKEAKKRSEVVEKQPKVLEYKPKSKRGTKRKKIEPEKEIENSENKKTTKKSKTKKEDSKVDKKTETKKTSKSTKTLKEEKPGEDVSKRKTKKADSKTKKEEKEDKEDLKVKDEEKKKSVKTKKKQVKKRNKI